MDYPLESVARHLLQKVAQSIPTSCQVGISEFVSCCDGISQRPSAEIRETRVGGIPYFDSFINATSNKSDVLDKATTSHPL